MRIQRVFKTMAAVAMFSVGISACSSVQQESNLYQELGGESGVAVIVNNFIMTIASDERVIDYFAVSNVQRFREKMVEHICLISDGPCTYTGDTMVDVHTGMDVKEGDFNAIVEDMMEALNESGVAIGTQNRLLARLATFRGEIIYL